jgi:predicted ATPase/DNA-binding CsgD family transcriptional regulator
MQGGAGAGAGRRVGNLPFDTTSFLGRRREISEVKRLLSVSRVVTITGPGGVGKTRLALRVARDVRRTVHDNVCYVELGELRDPVLLANTVAEKIGLHDRSGRAATDTIADHIGDSAQLLVLDNCEHLVDACAKLVDALTRACPRLTVLATSRQSLGLLAESRFPLAPLHIPDPDHVTSPDSIVQYDSVRLFVERAAAVVQRFHVTEANSAAVARICHDLEGIPLAIELAASRLRALSLDQLIERLAERYRLLGGVRGVPPRQRTLRALIDWSHELCTEDERHVWARVSVFSGSFELDAVEYVVAGDDVTPYDLVNIVDSLVDKSVLLREEADGTARFRMLEMMREYGEEKLAERGERYQARRCHRDWYERLSAQFAAEFIGPDEAIWVRRLRREHPNLRTALDFCAELPGEAVAGLRIATRLDDYWGIRGIYTELRHWLARTLPAAPGSAPERVAGLRMNAWYAVGQADIAEARRLLAEAAELNERLDIDVERAYLSQVSGLVALFTGDRDTAATRLEQSLAGLRAVRELRGELISMFFLGLTLGVRGQRDRGLALLEECVEKTARLGEVGWRSWTLWAVSQIEVPYGSLDRAEAAAKEALRLQQPLGIKLVAAFTLDTLAWIAERREQHTRAAELFGAASNLWHVVGASPNSYMGFETQHRRHTDLARQAMGDAAFVTAYERGRQMSTEEAIDHALEARQPTPSAPAPRGHEESVLTPREREIAGLVAEGLTNRAIAARLVISPRTADTHVEHILTKLNFTSRAQIATWIVTRDGPDSPDATV